MTAATLLDRLDGVKETGPGRWIARCPAHDDKSPSLSVRETDDGRTLLHDFGGCHIDDVLAALGLQMSDLFPDGPIANRVEPSRRKIPAADALRAVAHEVTVVWLIASRFANERQISETDLERLTLAAARINDARGTACPERFKPGVRP